MMAIHPLRDDLMVQQQLPAGLDNWQGAWQHMVAVIMLNQTGRKPVKTVFPIFMDRWPTLGNFCRATEEEVKEFMKEYLARSKMHMHVILQNDPIAKWIGLKHGDIVRIDRYNENSGESFSYRSCI
jgi:DNA-directed RNA polymerase subunit H (RpoH/RPB5)